MDFITRRLIPVQRETEKGGIKVRCLSGYKLEPLAPSVYMFDEGMEKKSADDIHTRLSRKKREKKG